MFYSRAKSRPEMSEITFSRASLNADKLPAYSGIGRAQISLVVSASMADQALAALMASEAIGFDTESKPIFLKGENLDGLPGEPFC